MKATSFSTLYAGLWLFFMIFVEYIPWRFLAGGEQYVPALDIIVAVFAGICLRHRISFLVFVCFGLLKDVCFGMPPGMNAALLAMAYIAALTARKVIASAPPLHNIIYAACCSAILCLPELIAGAWLYGRFPDGDILIGRAFSTLLAYPVLHTFMAITGHRLTVAYKTGLPVKYTPY